MRVAILRGASLNKWDMQIYEPLNRWFDIVGIGSKRMLGDAEGISFPVVKLLCPLQYISSLPKFIPVCFSLLGDGNWLWDFNRAVSKFDIIHSVELSNAYSLQAVRAKKRGLVKAVTLAVYENIPFVYDEYRARRKIKEEVIDGADHFFAVNEMTKEMLLLEGVSQSKISVVPQSVDTGAFRPYKNSEDTVSVKKMRRKFGFGKTDFVVLRVGRMVWEKGWYDLVQAAYKISKSKSKRKRVRFLFMGKGQERMNLIAMVKRLGLEDMVTVADPVPYKELADIYRLSDVFVQCSLPTRRWQEQLGTVVIEAMASGLPIVGTLSGATPITVGKEGGIFVKPQDFVSLAEAIESLDEDSTLRRKMGLRNRVVALAKYDNKQVAEKIKDIWQSLIASD